VYAKQNLLDMTVNPDFVSKILVTGGAGFIGQHLLKKLTHLDTQAVIIDNLSNRNENFNVARNKDSSYNDFFTFYNVDILNRNAVMDILNHEDIDTCIHLAAKISVPDSISNPYDTLDVNIKGTLNLLEACSKHNLNNFIFGSSAATYGEPKQLPIKEDHPLDPLSPYGASKAAGEALVSAYANLKKIKHAVILRFFNVFGQGQSPEYAGVITKFLERLSKGRAPIIYGDGKQTRDFISVNDVVDAILSAVNLCEKISHPEIINVATGKAVSINELAQFMIQISGLDIEPIYKKERKGDIKYNEVDVTKFTSVFGFTRFRSLQSELELLYSVLSAKHDIE
jgi:UDP-glucose 4-epimerase